MHMHLKSVRRGFQAVSVCVALVSDANNCSLQEEDEEERSVREHSLELLLLSLPQAALYVIGEDKPRMTLYIGRKIETTFPLRQKVYIYSLKM